MEPAYQVSGFRHDVAWISAYTNTQVVLEAGILAFAVSPAEEEIAEGKP